MSLQIAKSERAFPALDDRSRTIKVLIPYDGSESADLAFNDLMRAGLPQTVDAMVAVTNVWLPLSPYEITRAVSARRLMALTSGRSSFVPALRDHEEQSVLSLEAERRLNSIFPSAKISTEAMQDAASVASEILRKAKQWGADLIIVGSQSGPSRHITDYAGPALKVAREAHCSVRIARSSDRMSDSPIRRILIAVDGTTTATTDVIDAVIDRNWPAESEALLVVVRTSGPLAHRKHVEATAMLEDAKEELRAKGLKVSAAIKDGRADEVVVNEAREFAADCIFVASRGFTHQSGEDYDTRELSKATEAIALGANCSVEVVRAGNLDGPYLRPAA